MYKLFKYFMVLFIAVSITSCKEEEIPAEKPFFKMDEGISLAFRAVSGEQFVNVYTNKTFTATSSEPEWCQTAIVGKGRSNLQITVSQNDIAEERTAVITVSAEGYDNYRIQVKQAMGTPPRPVVEGVDERISNMNPDLYYAFHVENDLAAPFIGTAPLEFSIPESVTVAATPPDGRRAITVTRDNHVKVMTPVESGLKTYTMLYDVRVPALNLWYSLLQTNEGNSDDGDVFINRNGQIGVSNYSEPVIAANTWARIVVVVDVANGASVCKYYVNGKYLFANGSSSIPTRMVLNNYFWIFTDEDGEENDLDCSSFVVWAKTMLSDAEIAALGAP